MKKILLVMVFALLVSIPVFAAKSDILGLVPTATSMDEGYLEVEIGSDDPLNEFEDTLYFTAELGAFEGLEVGFDIAKDEEGDFEAIFDAKYSFQIDETQSMAAGFYNIADGYRAIPYMVYGINVLDDESGSCDFTVGAQLVEGKLRGLGALEYAMDAFSFTTAVDFGSNLNYSLEAGYTVGAFAPYIGINKAAGDVIEYYFGTTADLNENVTFEVGASIPEKGNLTMYCGLTFGYQIF